MFEACGDRTDCGSVRPPLNGRYREPGRRRSLRWGEYRALRAAAWLCETIARREIDVRGSYDRTLSLLVASGNDRFHIFESVMLAENGVNHACFVHAVGTRHQKLLVLSPVNAIAGTMIGTREAPITRLIGAIA